MKKIIVHSTEKYEGKYKIATEDYINNIFGSFLVLSFAGFQVYREGKIKNRVFNCICKNCNDEKIISARVLSDTKNTCKVCKRLKANENTLNVALKERYKVYKDGAKARGYEFDLSFSLFTILVLQNCHYCKIQPSNIYINRTSKIPTKLSGIDRKNNTIGYNELNCVACCKDCNRAKSSLSYDLFVEWMNRISKNIVNLNSEENNNNI